MISLFWRILLINVKSQSVLFLFLWVFFSKDCESNNNCNRDSPSRENKRIVEIFKNSGFSVNETWAIITTAFTIVAWTVFTDLNNDEITGKPCSFYPSGIWHRMQWMLPFPILYLCVHLWNTSNHFYHKKISHQCTGRHHQQRYVLRSLRTLQEYSWHWPNSRKALFCMIRTKNRLCLRGL